MAGQQLPRTLLEQLVREREATYEEQVAEFERLARELGEPATLTVRHLQRLAAGHRGAQRAQPCTRRVMRQLYGYALEELLGPPIDQAVAGSAPPTAPAGSDWQVLSQKFIPVYVGAEVTAQLAREPDLSPGSCEWLDVHHAQLSYPGASACTVTTFGFGVVVVQVDEVQEFNSIAEFAVWRRSSYQTARDLVFEQLSTRWPAITARPDYVLSSYWLTRHSWPGADVHTAMRLLCSPSVLLDRRESQSQAEMLKCAEGAERECFRDGFNRPDIAEFGVDGVAIGYASWSGVAYLPTAPDRALRPEEIAELETAAQALWCYTNRIAEEVEAGEDPVLPQEFGWRFLRACHSRLTTARPQETGQHRMMKDAILSTSRLAAQLVDTHAILRDLAPIPGRR